MDTTESESPVAPIADRRVSSLIADSVVLIGSGCTTPNRGYRPRNRYRRRGRAPFFRPGPDLAAAAFLAAGPHRGIPRRRRAPPGHHPRPWARPAPGGPR